MKLARLILTRVPTLHHSFSSSFRNVSRSPFHSSYCTTTITSTPKRQQWSSKDTLYKRISPVGNPHHSIVPILDKWVEDGRNVKHSDLRFIIKDLRHHRRFKHALEVSNWMSEKRIQEPTAGNVAIHLDLIAKVHGVKEAENYFNTASMKLRTLETYSALLNCFAQERCVDKAEGVMQKMRDLGFASYSMAYNVMLNLYCRTGNREKLDAILHEMESKNIKFDSFTYSILLNAYGTDCDLDEIDKVLAKMESDPEIDIDWMTYAIAAKQYLRAQCVDKALESLKKSEKLVTITKRRNEAYTEILTHYATAGKKEEVLRVWQECKLCKANNRDYIALLSSILKFDDLETADRMFKEWEDSNLCKDVRITNILIRAYCERGLIEKAEALVERVKTEKWQKPDSFTWSWMSFGYVKNNQMPKAVEAMESALVEYHSQLRWIARQETVAACLNYLKDKGDSERVHAMMESLRDKCVLPAESHEKLVKYLSGNCSFEDVFDGDSAERTRQHVAVLDTD